MTRRFAVALLLCALAPLVACQPEASVPAELVYSLFSQGDPNGGDSHGGDAAPPDVPWWNGAWAFRRPLTITAADALVDGYALNFFLEHYALVAAGESLDTGDDVRVVRWDGSTWTDLHRFASFPSFNYTDPQPLDSSIWFALQAAVGAGETTREYWVYYGNDFAQTPREDPDQVLIYRSTFGTGTLTDWDTYGVVQAPAYTTGAGGLCTDGSNSAQNTTLPYINDKLVLNAVGPLHQVRVLFSFGPGPSTPLDDDLIGVGLCSADGVADGFYTGVSGGGDWFDGLAGGSPIAGFWRSADGGAGQASQSGAVAALDPADTHVFDAAWTQNEVTVYIDRELVGSWSDGPANPGRLCLVANSMSSVCLGQLTIRHYVSNEPTVILGPVESAP